MYFLIVIQMEEQEVFVDALEEDKARIFNGEQIKSSLLSFYLRDLNIYAKLIFTSNYFKRSKKC